MNDVYYTTLIDRDILSITGPDSLAFLQGIVTNDLEKLNDKIALYSAILTPQGKYLHDFFIFEVDGNIYIDCPKNQIDSIEKKLNMYRLRANLEITKPGDAYSVFSLTGPGVIDITQAEEGLINSELSGKGIIFFDPRLNQLGARAVLKKNSAIDIIINKGFIKKDYENYNELQISMGIPGGIDVEFLRGAFPLELGFSELNAISFEKGCYVGQEVTARMKVRNLVKKRLVPVLFDGASLKAGTTIYIQDKPVGQVFAAANDKGVVMFRIEKLLQILKSKEELIVDQTKVRPTLPDWFNINV
ncbi:MAG: hypothetical protein VX434_09300 [Pseudomonadota bacterium]|nr:hypothetical protein [Pseudomonadota bacterium]